MTALVVEPARRILAIELNANVTSSTEVAAAAARVWEKLANHFSRIVGGVGVRILLERSVVITRARFPWLDTGEAGEAELPWATLRATLARREAGDAAAAFEDLLATFIGLIGQFIGNALVAQLLHEVWAEVFPQPERGTM